MIPHPVYAAPRQSGYGAVRPAVLLAARATRGGIYFWLIVGYLLLLPVQLKLSESMRIAPSDVILLLYLLAATPTLRYCRTRTWSLAHAGLLLAFCTGTLVAVLQHGEAGVYVLVNKDLGLLVLFAAYAAICAEAATWQRIRLLLKVFIATVGLTNVVALISFFGYAPVLSESVLHLEYGGRLAGMLIDPNAYGGLLAVTFAIHAITFYSPKPILGGIPGALLALSLVTGIVFTYSRSTWISVAFALFVAIAMNWRRAGYLVGTIAVIIGIVWCVADVDYLDDMAHMARRPDQVEIRLEVFNRAMAVFADNPVLGVGLGMFNSVAQRGDRLSPSHGVIIHNTSAWFLTEFGLLGFILFLAFIGWFWVSGFKAYRSAPPLEKPLVLGLVAAHTAMLGLSMGIEALYQRHWWLVMALIAATRCLGGAPAVPALSGQAARGLRRGGA